MNHRKEREKIMEKMKELYQKVVKDTTLQEKFNQIMSDAKNAGEEATGTKLVLFAKEAGYEVTLEEMQEFFKSMTEKSEEELSELELDMVAGGKGKVGVMPVVSSVISMGVTCATGSAAFAVSGHNCRDYFK